MKTIRLLLVTFGMSLGSLAHAVGDEIPVLEMGVGSDIGVFKYNELSTPNDTEAGVYASLLADVKIHDPGLLSNLELRYDNASFKSSYNGYNLSTLQAATATDSLTLTDYAATVNVALSDDVYIYGGYGHHVWNRGLNYGTGYTEIYSWDFIPLGVQAWFYKSPFVEAAIDVGVLPMANGKINVITSKTFAGGQDSTATLGAKTGYKVKVPIRWYSGNFSITTTPWFSHNEIGFSNTFTNTTLFSGGGQGYEPSSETLQYGVEVLLGVRF